MWLCSSVVFHAELIQSKRKWNSDGTRTRTPNDTFSYIMWPPPFFLKVWTDEVCTPSTGEQRVFFVKDCFKVDLKKLGPKIENYALFPERTNVTFAQVLDKKNIKVNVWERGAGQTKACGTAACATAVAASVKGLVDKNSNIHFKEGNLQIDCKEEVFMTGPISKVKKIMVDI